MNAIEQHIDNMFKDLPETEEIKRIKNDLYLNALDRYDELIALGKTESEALGTIIIEMGELDVLLEDFGYDQETDLENYSLNTLEDVQSYIAFNRRESNKIGLGVLLILVGAGLVPSFATYNLEVVGVILLLVFIASAVGLFVSSGLRTQSIEKDFEDEEYIFYLTDKDYETVEYDYSMVTEKERYRIPIGVMLCILSATPILALTFLNQEIYVQRFGILLLTLSIGIGVFQFIKYGMINSAYEKVLNIGEYSFEERRFQQKIEPIAGIYWMTITLIYFIWSFTTMNWNITWIVWPTAGVLWGLVALSLKMAINRKDFR